MTRKHRLLEGVEYDAETEDAPEASGASEAEAAAAAAGVQPQRSSNWDTMV